MINDNMIIHFAHGADLPIPDIRSTSNASYGVIDTPPAENQPRRNEGHEERTECIFVFFVDNYMEGMREFNKRFPRPYWIALARRLAKKGRQHSRVGPHSLCCASLIYIILIPLRFQFRACL